MPKSQSGMQALGLEKTWCAETKRTEGRPFGIHGEHRLKTREERSGETGKMFTVTRKSR